MHIVNAMFGRGLGGIEQSFADYCAALSLQGHKVTALIQPKAEIEMYLLRLQNHVEIKKVRNYGLWDVFSVIRLRLFLRKNRPDAIITHGTRAASLMKKAAKNIAPIIGVVHNYSISRIVGLDAVFTVTKKLKDLVIKTGQQKNTVYHIPNMIDMHNMQISLEHHNPPVIGTMGRFVKKKAIDNFLRALAKLRDAGIEFKAVIGGEGQEEKKLQKLASDLGLDEVVTFIGWVNDKEQFYNSIDIFCLPSLHEPFGIVLLEAFSHMVPVVTTDTEGPSEIATDGYNALIVQKEDVGAMSKAFNILINDKKKSAEIATNGLDTVKKEYEISVVGKRIETALTEIVQRAKQ